MRSLYLSVMVDVSFMHFLALLFVPDKDIEFVIDLHFTIIILVLLDQILNGSLFIDIGFLYFLLILDGLDLA